MDIRTVVRWFFTIIIVAAIFLIMFKLVDYLPMSVDTEFRSWIRFFLWFCVAFVAIGMLLNAIGINVFGKNQTPPTEGK